MKRMQNFDKEAREGKFLPFCIDKIELWLHLLSDISGILPDTSTVQPGNISVSR